MGWGWRVKHCSVPSRGLRAIQLQRMAKQKAMGSAVLEEMEEQGESTL